MSKNGIALSVVAVILAAVYVYFFTDVFSKKTILIMCTTRPGRFSNTRDPNQEPVYQVSFGFDGKYQLTSVKVVAADDLATNKYPVPLWHLITDSNSVPVKSIDYGHPVKGMKSAVARAQPDPLQADIEYVLLLEAGKTRAQTNFHTARAPLAGK
jgi:hypothetical protein